jgi:hypothetical protein
MYNLDLTKQEIQMHALKGRKQTPEHIAKRMAAIDWEKRRPGGGRPASTPKVLWSKVDIREPYECWPWKGFLNKHGYGRTWIKDKGYYAHRVIYDLEYPGQITLQAPENGEYGLVLHTCDNPPCCNPRHLYIGDAKQNSHDKVTRNRMPDMRGVRGSRAKLTEEDVREIRRLKPQATINALMLLFDVSKSTICGCLYGRHYQDVQ